MDDTRTMWGPRFYHRIKQVTVITVFILAVLVMVNPTWARDIQGAFLSGVVICRRTTERVVQRVESAAKRFTNSTFSGWTNPYKRAP